MIGYNRSDTGPVIYSVTHLTTSLGFITALLRGETCDLVAAVFRTWSPLTQYCRDQDGSMLWVLWQLLTSVSKSHLSSWMCFNQFSYLSLGKIVTLQHIFHPDKQNIHVSIYVNYFTEVNWGSPQKWSEIFTMLLCLKSKKWKCIWIAHVLYKLHGTHIKLIKTTLHDWRIPGNLIKRIHIKSSLDYIAITTIICKSLQLLR